MGVIEKCIGWVLVYPFLGGLFLIKNTKRMCICEYVIFSIDTCEKCLLRFKKGNKQFFVPSSAKTDRSRPQTKQVIHLFESFLACKSFLLSIINLGKHNKFFLSLFHLGEKTYGLD